ncbi:hypothetical protein C7377_1280 [Balneicella halophila]|uniref:C4-type zinc ribbon domain-containing protein n=1 Tax=Balneicella halophila TaxID=1537566 RepID=A0A7L4UP50_BALHA|nr:C4-type zinc ribbon domain-containing protein [Balneicella halophila]PVX50950.1 hypothetical protein C7377_1280 [Balneicella halophila]
MAKKTIKTNKEEVSVEDKLKSLYELQQIDSEIDEIRKLRGELPLEVEDLEDEVAGLQTRVAKHDEELKESTASISAKKNEIKEHQALIEKYTKQQNNVRNNREFNALSKEIEFKELEIELAEKHIKEFSATEDFKKEAIKQSKDELKQKTALLKEKKSELKAVIAETEKDEKALEKKSQALLDNLEERLAVAYTRIRSNARNGLAVVTVNRDACGGCFNKIPPQRQLDIRARKKIIVCEHCGRILVDKYINDDDNTQEQLDIEKAAQKKKRTVRKRKVTK